MSFYTWMTWCVLGAAAASLGVVVGRIIRLRASAVALLGVLAAATAVSGIVLVRFSSQPAPVLISITSPENFATITGNRVVVTGTVRPASARVTLVIRSERALEWWVQRVVRSQRMEGDTGLWTINAFLGTPTEGAHENFHLVALASADSVWYDLVSGRDLRFGQHLRAVPAWSQSDPVVVWRTQ